MASPPCTPATLFLQARNAPHTLQAYDYAPAKGAIGVQAAQALGAGPECVFKTLALKIDRTRPAFALLPVNTRADYKKIAALLGGRNAKMIQPAEAHERTGYQQGGTTPLGAREIWPVVLNSTALCHLSIWINAGAQGLLACLTPQELVHLTHAQLASITQHNPSDA